MVQLILTLTSGVQVVYLTEDRDARENVQAIRAGWENPAAALVDVVLGSADGTTDWVRMAHISAVRITPAVDEEGGPDAPTG